MTASMTLVERLPSTGLFMDGKVPGPLSEEARRWLVEQLNAWPNRVHEERTCCIGALTDMATTEFCRLMAERDEAADAIETAEKALALMPDEIEVFRIMQRTGGPRGEMAKAIGERIEEIRTAALTKLRDNR